jgi:hypothetical protein
VFFCARCGERIEICRNCDYGQKYCPKKDCASLSRLEAKRRYRAAFQSTRCGRRFHAKAQARYRLMCILSKYVGDLKKVTDQASTPVASSATVPLETAILAGEEENDRAEPVPQAQSRVRCAFCGRFCGPFVHRWFGSWL